MTKEELIHITDICFNVPVAVRRADEIRTYHEHECEEAKKIVLKMLEQEPKTGRWEFVGDNCYRCTACGEVYTSNQFDAINNYYDNRFPKGCPNCGAKMEREEKT